MNAIDSLTNILNTELVNVDCRYCLLKGMDKVPYTAKGVKARPNVKEDFVDILDIADAENLTDYACLGISVQASNITAIDVDHCFHTPFDITSGDDRAKDIINRFKDLPVYIEFSFSGKGLRIILRQLQDIEDYNSKYYIKNSNTGIEYYQPSGGARYVSITGRSISNHIITSEIDFTDVIVEFLDKYMTRPQRPKITPKTSTVETRTLEELKKKVKMECFNNYPFQKVYLGHAPGSGKDESERDFFIVSYLYENVTQDVEMIKALFENSRHYKTKDWKHKNKWDNRKYNGMSYLEYLLSQLKK